MTDHDQLPALPYLTLNGLSIEQWKARADALRAEVETEKRRTHQVAMDYLALLNAAEKRADALEAALNTCAKALSAMLTHMGMDEDEWNRPTFEQAREAERAARALLEKT